MYPQKELEQALREATAADLEAIRRNPALSAPFLQDIDEEVIDDLIETKQQIDQLSQDLKEARERNEKLTYDEVVQQGEAACAEIAAVKSQAEQDIKQVFRGCCDEDDALYTASEIQAEADEAAEDILLDSPMAEELLQDRIEQQEDRHSSLIAKVIATKA